MLWQVSLYVDAGGWCVGGVAARDCAQVRLHPLVVATHQRDGQLHQALGHWVFAVSGTLRGPPRTHHPAWLWRQGAPPAPSHDSPRVCDAPKKSKQEYHHVCAASEYCLIMLRREARDASSWNVCSVREPAASSVVGATARPSIAL